MADKSIDDLVARLKIIVQPEKAGEAQQIFREMDRAVIAVRDNAARAAKGLTDSTKAAKGLSSALLDASKALGSLERVGSNFNSIASKLDQLARLTTENLDRFSQGYARAAGLTEKTSARVAAAMQRTEAANMRSGRVAQEALLPSLEAGAKAAEDWARFSERHPQVIQFMGDAGNLVSKAVDLTKLIGTTIDNVGNILSLPDVLRKAGEELDENVIKPIKAIMQARREAKEAATAAIANRAADKQLAAANLANRAADKNMGAASRSAVGGAAAPGLPLSPGLMLGGALAGGALAGLAGGELLYQARDSAIGRAYTRTINTAVSGVTGQESNLQIVSPIQELGKIVGGAALAFGQAVNNDNFRLLGVSIAELTGAVDANTAAQLESAITGKAAPTALEMSPQRQQAVEAFADYQRDLVAQEKAVAKQRAEVVKNLREQENEAYLRHYEQRFRADKDFVDRQRADYLDFLKQSEKSRKALLKSFAEDDEETAHRREIENRNLAREQQEAEENYYEEREKIVADGSEAALRAEQEFQKQMRRSMEDHYWRLEDLTSDRDALGLVRAQREYERQRRRSEEDYNEQRAQQSAEIEQRLKDASEGFAAERENRLAEMELRRRDEDAETKWQRDRRVKAFNEEQAEARREFDERQRLERDNFDKQQREAQTAFEKQQAALRENSRKQLAQIETQAKEERDRRVKAFNDQLIKLDANLLGQTQTQARYYQLMAEELEKYLKNQKALIASGGQSTGYEAPVIGTADDPAVRAAQKAGRRVVIVPGARSGSGGGEPVVGQAIGGYASQPGLYLRGEGMGREFTLNNTATTAAESILRGRLTQGRVLGALGGPSIYVDVGGINASGDPVTIARLAGEMVERRVMEALQN